MTTCYNLSNSLPPERLEMLVCFRRIAGEQRVPFLLVGATVRELILVNHYRIEWRAKTRDLDFGVMLPDWGGYERLAQALIANGFQPNARRPHEFRYGESNWIDLIPFGLIGQDNQIAWPPERAIIMNIIGYEDVFRAAVEIDFGEGIRIQSASLPGYVLLKLFAWNDRPRERTKDLKEIWWLLETYYVAGEVDNRLHAEHPDLLDLPAENYRDLAGARILGRDMAKLCSHSTCMELKELLERECKNGDNSTILNEFEKESGQSFAHVNERWMEFVKGCLEGVQ